MPIEQRFYDTLYLLLHKLCIIQFMTWLSKLLEKTGIKTGLSSRQSRVPAGLWVKCANCGSNILAEKLRENLNVCEYCMYHHTITISHRIEITFDPGFRFIEAELPPDDPIGFVDSKSYKQRLADARSKSEFKDAFAIVDGNVFGMPIIGFVMDFNFIGGSMGIAVGNGIALACKKAIERRVPVVIFCASGGARMQESMFSLLQMPRTTIAVESVKKFGLPYIAVLTNPTTGGVLASFAMRATITLAEPDSIIGFTGQRVIKDTLGIKLPKGFQSPGFVYERGFLDQIIERKDMKNTLAKLLRLFN